jgi:membrane protein DedA with SNARE-associated domain
MTTALITHLLQSYGYIAVFLLVGLESMGIPLPGETMLIAAAVYAGSTHNLNIALVGLVAAAAAIAGDNAGFWLGKHAGTRLVRRYGRWSGWIPRNLKSGATCSPATAARSCFSAGSPSSCGPTQRFLPD